MSTTLEDELRQSVDRSWLLASRAGQREAQERRTYDVISPATGARIASAPDATAADVDDIVAGASDAATEWARVEPRARGACLRALATALRENVDELSALDALDSGNPVTAMRNDVVWGAEVLDLFADWSTHLSGEQIPATVENLHYTRYKPYGVVARIVPFNHPIFFAAAKVAAPLMAGNAVVLKPSDLTPLSAMRLGELAENIFPAGTLSVVTGGPEPSSALVKHPAVRRIGFIGSEQVGRLIQRDAASVGVKDVTLELGGKNALIVFPDADLEAAAEGIIRGMNFAWSAGQSCGSTSRVLLHEDVAHEVLERVESLTRAITIGQPLDPATQMGPLASPAQLEKSLHYIGLAQEQGAQVVTGGRRPPGEEFEKGYFIEPAVITGVRPDMRIAQEEVFGPVMSVLTFAKEDEAVSIANALDYGLTASIWTRDVSRAIRTAQAMDAGYVWVNGSSRHFWGMPFGGVKSSGIGREESVEELLSYSQVQAVNILV